MLPAALSPTSNVRRSCQTLMSDPPIMSDLDGACGQGDGLSSFERKATGRRTVGIDARELDRLARSIADSILSQKSQFAQWDEGGWHYTAASYRRPSSLGDVETDVMRMERVALYVLTLDAINFCFWPTSDDGSELGGRNLLEYEHLAIALKKAAEMDEDEKHKVAEAGGDNTIIGEDFVRSEATYALSPRNLASLTPSRLLDLVAPHLPRPTPGEKYILPNLGERVHLLNELGQGLIEHHAGSALRLIRSANRSADRLVDLLSGTFRGFRDEAVDDRGRHVCFYKRAQIAAADLWAAVGPEGLTREGTRLPRRRHPLGNVCDFVDIETLTMFADYRVPQLLRHLGVLRYGPSLAEAVDGGAEMRAGCMDELYLRAGTVVAVDRLVDAVTKILREEETRSRKGEDGGTSPAQGREDSEKKLCAVKMDWHLWQAGEKLGREGKLGRHHLVHTIFY